MKVEKDIQKTLEFDSQKVEACYSDLIEVFRKHKLRIGEILIAYGNLGYSLGASMEGYQDEGPGMEVLNKLYYSRPTPGIGLMIQGMIISSWYSSYANIVVGDKDK